MNRMIDVFIAQLDKTGVYDANGNKISVQQLWKDRNLKTDYNAMKRTELQALCKERNLPATGTKAVLVERLGGVVKESKKKTMSNASPILNYLEENRPNFIIRRNAFNNFEHAETKFVFDPNTREVIGKQQGESVVELCDEDFLICREYNWSYKI